MVILPFCKGVRSRNDTQQWREGLLGCEPAHQGHVWAVVVVRPEVIRCDNGPEYNSAAIQSWAQEWGIRLEYIQPGKPQQNAYVERINRTVR